MQYGFKEPRTAESTVRPLSQQVDDCRLIVRFHPTHPKMIAVNASGEIVSRCGKCGHEVTITNFSGTVKGGDLLLIGSCSECRGDVARLIESEGSSKFKPVLTTSQSPSGKCRDLTLELDHLTLQRGDAVAQLRGRLLRRIDLLAGLLAGEPDDFVFE